MAFDLGAACKVYYNEAVAKLLEHYFGVVPVLSSFGQIANVLSIAEGDVEKDMLQKLYLKLLCGLEFQTGFTVYFEETFRFY